MQLPRIKFDHHQSHTEKQEFKNQEIKTACSQLGIGELQMETSLRTHSWNSS